MVNFPPRRRRRRLPRSPARRALRCPLRRLNRAGIRSLPGHRPGTGDLAQALTAFRRAITCHRRLARLAPRFFDATVVDRERRERADHRRWMALAEPALNKVYGCDPAPLSSLAPDDLPPLPSRRTQRAVERELAGWDFWMAAGRLALDRHQQRRPRALMSFTGLARLLQLAMDFGLLACGQPAPPELSFEDRYANCMSDLERAYGPASPPSADTENPAVSPDSPVKPPSLQTKPVGRESSRAVPNSPADPVGPAGSPADLRQQASAPSPTTASQPSPRATGPAAAAWPPSDDKPDLIPHALVVGPHGLLCLQRLEPHQPR